MNKDKNANPPRFITCGDAMEKMDEIREEDIGNVNGGLPAYRGAEQDGINLENDFIKDETMLIIPIN